MIAFDEKEVPILNFHNPAKAIYYPEGLYTYSMGNTRKRSIAEQIGTSMEQHLDLLFLACGDIRNVLCTVSELSQRRAHQCPKSIDIHLNDYDPAILPRNAIILDIISKISPDVRDDVDFLWNVWYNMTLSDSHQQRLQQIIVSLLDKSMNDDGGDSVLQFDSRSKLDCIAVWKDWMKLKLDEKRVKEERKRFNEQKVAVNDFCENVICKIENFTPRSANLFDEANPVRIEINDWFRHGTTTTDENTSINPTLIRPFSHGWKIHYSSCPFEGYLPLQMNDSRHGCLTTACKEILALWVKRYQEFTKQHPVKVYLWAGDCLWLCTSGLPRELLFDVIDTSNVSDHIGLLNVLICCGPRLKRAMESQLQTSSILWSSMCKNIQGYYDNCIGIDTMLLPTVLGLHLAVDMDMGNRRLPDIFSSEETLYWVRAKAGFRTPLTLKGKESDIVTALWTLTKRCFDLEKESFHGKPYGASLSSPITLLRIIHQMNPYIQDGGSRILDLLECKLPCYFHTKHSYMWKLLKSIVKPNEGRIVEIQVRNLQLTVSNLFQAQTPIPTLVILKGSQFSENVPIFLGYTDYNSGPPIISSIRFNIKEGTIIFHMTERDWITFSPDSLLNIVDHDTGIPVFCCRPFNLGNKNDVHHRFVDEVEAFGLHSGQAFSIESDMPKASTLLEISKIEEESSSYTVELGMLDFDKCNAKDMRIEFCPETCPIEITIHFLSSIGCNMRFSCPVSKSSRFQLSRKQRRIVCQVPKIKDCVTGEMALQNPAQVPFHAIKEQWNDQLEDTILVCGRMFRSKGDHELKRLRKTGPSFYALRESISCILQMELSNSQVQCIHSVEDSDHIKSLIKHPKDVLQKAGLIIKVRKPVYKWESIPYAKCVFYDCKQHTDLLKVNPARASEMTIEFWEESLNRTGVVNRIEVEQGELKLFRRMMHVNAARTEQEKPPSSVWKDSFICPLFPRDKHIEKLSELAWPSMDTAIVTNDGGPRAMQSSSQEDSHHSTEQELGQALQTATPDKVAHCAFCKRISADLKRCTNCKKVSYCDQQCQRKHWKKDHKLVCSKQ